MSGKLGDNFFLLFFFLFLYYSVKIAEGLKLPEWTKPNYFQQIKSILYDEKNLQTINGNPSFQKFTIGK